MTQEQPETNVITREGLRSLTTADVTSISFQGQEIPLDGDLEVYEVVEMLGVGSNAEFILQDGAIEIQMKAVGTKG